MNEEHSIGNTTIVVSDDEFFNAYQAGYLYYHTDFKGHALTEIAVYEVMMQTTLSVYHSCRWNAGYLAGWFAALHEPERTRSTEVRLLALQAVSSGGQHGAHHLLHEDKQS